MIILAMGVCTALNVIVILHKFRKLRIFDATLDLSIMAVLGFMFVGTITGLSIASIASALTSVYLWRYPIKIIDIDKIKDLLNK